MLLLISTSRMHTASAQANGITKPQDISEHEKPLACIESDAKGNKIRDLSASTSRCGGSDSTSR
jgi:hypothetical protein